MFMSNPAAGADFTQGGEEVFRLLREQAEQGVPFRGGVTEGLEDVAAALAVAELFVFEHAPGDTDHVEEVPHGGGGVQNCDRDLRKLTAGANVYEYLCLPGNKAKTSQTEIDGWLHKLPL